MCLIERRNTHTHKILIIFFSSNRILSIHQELVHRQLMAIFHRHFYHVQCRVIFSRHRQYLT